MTRAVATIIQAVSPRLAPSARDGGGAGGLQVAERRAADLAEIAAVVCRTAAGAGAGGGGGGVPGPERRRARWARAAADGVWAWTARDRVKSAAAQSARRLRRCFTKHPPSRDVSIFRDASLRVPERIQNSINAVQCGSIARLFVVCQARRLPPKIILETPASRSANRSCAARAAAPRRGNCSSAARTHTGPVRRR